MLPDFIIRRKNKEKQIEKFQQEYLQIDNSPPPDFKKKEDVEEKDRGIIVIELF